MSIGWKNDWARWRARDEDGELFEFEYKPVPRSYVWLKTDGRQDLAGVGERCSTWRDTLEARPVESGEPVAESHDGTLTGAALHRAIADAIDAGEGPEAFEHWAHVTRRWVAHSTFKGLVAADSRGAEIRRKPTMRSATLPNGEVVEWPAPMTTEPAEGSAVWVICDRGNPNMPWYWFLPSPP